jgi:glutathione synthase
MFDFAAWPPELSKEQLETLTLYATTYALSHGLTYLPPVEQQLLFPTAAIHAPFTLLPSPFPRRLFEKARRLQRSYNILYARIAMDIEFLDRVMGAEQGLGKVDSFIGQLWRGWKQLREVGLAQVDPSSDSSWKFGLILTFILLADYFLHFQPEDDEKVTIKQVEFNTFSCAFGGLSPKTTALHR